MSGAGRDRPARVAVVGGGMAGLAAAYFLTRPAAQAGRPLEVTVFEAAGRPGGHVVSEQVNGFLVEGGPDCFVSQKPWGIRLARELGLGAALTNTAPAGSTYVLSGGRLHALPDGIMLMVPTRFLPLARSRLLTWPGKLRMGLDLALPRGGEGDESLGDFVRRRLGREALEKIAEPLVAGVHAGDPDRLSLRATFARFKEMEETDRSLIVAMLKARRRTAAARKAAPSAAAGPSAFVALAGGLETLIHSLTGALPAGALRLGARVTRLERRDGGYFLDVGGRPEIGGPSSAGEYFDAVVVTAPTAEAGRLVAGLDSALAGELAAIETVSAVTASLAWPREQVAHPLNGFGLVIPRGEKRRIMGITWTSSKFPGRAPAGQVLVRAFLGGVKGPQVLQLSDEEILAIVRAEVGELLGVAAAPTLSRIYRWPDAMPQYNVGHAARLDRIDARLAALPGLHLAGGSYRGIGIPDCIAGGQAAAAAVVAQAAPAGVLLPVEADRGGASPSRPTAL